MRGIVTVSIRVIGVILVNRVMMVARVLIRVIGVIMVVRVFKGVMTLMPWICNRSMHWGH